MDIHMWPKYGWFILLLKYGRCGLRYSLVRDGSSCFLHLARQTFPTCAYLSLFFLLLRNWSTTTQRSLELSPNVVTAKSKSMVLPPVVPWRGPTWPSVRRASAEHTPLAFSFKERIIRAVLIEEQKMVVKVLKGTCHVVQAFHCLLKGRVWGILLLYLAPHFTYQCFYVYIPRGTCWFDQPHLLPHLAIF